MTIFEDAQMPLAALLTVECRAKTTKPRLGVFIGTDKTYIVSCLTVAGGLQQRLGDVLELVETRMNVHIDVQWPTGDHRQLGNVDEITEPDRNHADAVLTTDCSLDGRQVREHVGVAVADDDGDVWNAVAVAVLTLERRVVDEAQRGLCMRPVAEVRHSSDCLDDVLLHLAVVVHLERYERLVAPVDQADSRPVHAYVQFVDHGDDHLLDDFKSCRSDAS